MMKIVLLIPTLDRSGAEKQFTLLATGLPKSEFEVSVVTLTRTGPYEQLLHDANIPVTNLQKRWKFDPFALRKLKRLLREEQPDILHTWLFAANAYGRMAVGKSAKSPHVIISERCVDSWKAGWQHWVDRRLTSRTSRLIANSESVAEFYRNQKFPADKIDVIPNGIAIPQSPLEDRDAVLAKFDIPAGARIIGFVGRLARQKRVKDLTWAMQLLQQLTDNIFFLIVGEGPEQTAAEQLARQMGIDHLFRFVGHRDDASELIKTMNVFWLGSDFEGQSNSLMEAMAAGVPVVATDIPPNRELVVDGETGFLVKVGDTAGFAQFTDRILADPALAKRLGTAGEARMKNNFSIENLVESHVALYRQLMGAN
jgi:glycosyltransferase involved in cell wall biosynthesis